MFKRSNVTTFDLIRFLMKTYRISPSGRRTALILLVGALIIWVFALWTFSSTLGISYNPVAFLGTLRASIAVT